MLCIVTIINTDSQVLKIEGQISQADHNSYEKEHMVSVHLGCGFNSNRHINRSM